jgi:hypothetical protein
MPIVAFYYIHQQDIHKQGVPGVTHKAFFSI